MTQHNDNDKLREAARNLVNACDQVANDSKDVFLVAYSHLGPYTGKQFGPELEALRALLDADPTPTWQAHEPVEGAVAQEGATWALLRNGMVVAALEIHFWCAIPKDRAIEVIAYCTSAEPPAKDAEGYYKHDGSAVAPVSGDAEVDVFKGFARVRFSHARNAGWRDVTRWRPVGAE